MDVPKKIQELSRVSLAARNIHAAEQVKYLMTIKSEPSAYLTNI